MRRVMSNLEYGAVALLRVLQVHVFLPAAKQAVQPDLVDGLWTLLELSLRGEVMR